jgi:hypothetical protein
MEDLELDTELVWDLDVEDYSTEVEENEEDTSREHYKDLEEAQTVNCAI